MSKTIYRTNGHQYLITSRISVPSRAVNCNKIQNLQSLMWCSASHKLYILFPKLWHTRISHGPNSTQLLRTASHRHFPISKALANATVVKILTIYRCTLCDETYCSKLNEIEEHWRSLEDFWIYFFNFCNWIKHFGFIFSISAIEF